MHGNARLRPHLTPPPSPTHTHAIPSLPRSCVLPTDRCINGIGGSCYEFSTNDYNQQSSGTDWWRHYSGTWGGFLAYCGSWSRNRYYYHYLDRPGDPANSLAYRGTCAAYNRLTSKPIARIAQFPCAPPPAPPNPPPPSPPPRPCYQDCINCDVIQSISVRWDGTGKKPSKYADSAGTPICPLGKYLVGVCRSHGEIGPQMQCVDCPADCPPGAYKGECGTESQYNSGDYSKAPGKCLACTNGPEGGKPGNLYCAA